MSVLCKHCGKETTPTTKYHFERLRYGLGIYCGPECSSAFRAKLSSETMARTNRKYASARMKAKNPMHRQEIRSKMSATLRAMGWGPTVRGGNGCPPTPQQQAMAEALGWEMEVVVPTGHHQRDGSGYPTCYKLDVGNEELKVGVEVDGFSHCSFERQEMDHKKDEFLDSLGWLVLRFKNKEVDTDLEGCVRKVREAIR